jgi:glycerol-3-phosphate dehydrogenase
MTTSHWLRPHTFKTPDMSADVVIVGGGYAGLASAYWISEYRPDLKIIIIERSQLGAGASGRNAGFLTRGSATFYKSLSKEWGKERALSLYQFGNESINLVHQHILKSSPEIKFEKASSLTVFQTEADKKSWDDPTFNPSRKFYTFINEYETRKKIKLKDYAPEYVAFHDYCKRLFLDTQ